MRDVFNMARFHFPDNMSSPAKLQLAEHIEECFSGDVREKLPDRDQGSQYCLDSSLYSLYSLAHENIGRHEFFESRTARKPGDGETNGTVKNTSTNILDDLTKEDVFHLCETEDEASQSQGYLLLLFFSFK